MSELRGKTRKSDVIDRIENETAQYMTFLPYLTVMSRKELQALHGRLEDLYMELTGSEPEGDGDARETWEGLREDLNELLDGVLSRLTEIDGMNERLRFE